MVKKVNINKYPATKKYVSIYFHAHQPFRLSNYSIFDVGTDRPYFEGPVDFSNKTIIERVATRGYTQANGLFLDLIKTKGFKVSYSLSGTLLEQLEMHAPEVIDQFRAMAKTKKVEMISETYYHSLSFFYSLEDFLEQVKKHKETIKRLFNQDPKVFRNTELTFRNDVGEVVRLLGFKGVYAEGWDPILEWRSPNYLYKPKKIKLSNDQLLLIKSYSEKASREIKLLLKNYRRSDDIAFRFQLKGWEGYPVTADKVANWISEEPGELVNLCMDYETIGEHHRVESGIFEFYRHLPDELAKRGIEFILPSEAIGAFKSQDELDYHDIVSWADMERDLSAWLGNKMQEESFKVLYELEPQVRKVLSKLKNTENKEKLLDTWGKLQTSDHFYYMSTKYWSDGDVHKYFSPFNSPYEAYINFMNVVRDFRVRYLGF